jgi:hypothetical protein
MGVKGPKNQLRGVHHMSGIGQVSDEVGIYVATFFWTTLTSFNGYISVEAYEGGDIGNPRARRKTFLTLGAIEAGLTALWLPYFVYCAESQHLVPWHWGLVLGISIGIPVILTVINYLKIKRR